MKNYAIRCMVQDWGKPPEGESIQVREGVRVQQDDHGYTDRLFLVSIVNDDSGKPQTALLLDSIEGGELTVATLKMIRRHIDHYLEHHAKR